MTNLHLGSRRTLRRSSLWTLRWLMALALVTAPAGGASAQDRKPVGSAAERQTRGETAAKLFVQGRYDEALAIYLDLYVQSGGRPEYLRNIGRCQQKLKQYDRAIESLKDYLRRARNLAASERTEVQGFISEMEAAKSAEASAPPSSGATVPVPVAPRPATAPAPAAPAAVQPAAPAAMQPAAAAPTSPATTTALPPSSSPPAAAPATTGAPAPLAASTSPAPVPLDPANQPGTAPVLITQTPAPAPASDSPSWSRLKMGGVVALIGSGVLAAVGTAMLLSSQSTYDEAKKAGCPQPGSTMCEQKAKSVTTSNQISQVLYVGAGLAGAAGVTMLILAPAPGSTETRVSLGARFTF